MSKAAELAALIGSGQAQGSRNLFLNPQMQLAQRGTSAVAAGAGTYPSIDRIKCYESTDGAFTLEQSTTVPSNQGFSNSAKFVVTTADTSLAAGQYAQATQVIEAQNLQHLNYGTSGAKALTLSFWCRSSKTGTYCITIVKEDSTATQYVKEFSVSSADTWEKKTITIEPDSNITAAAGAIANDNGAGLYVYWNFAQGSTYTGATDDTWSTNTNHFATTNQVNWMDSTSNDFYLTGIQLEIGYVATPFEHRSYGDELESCRRYFLRYYGNDSPSYPRWFNPAYTTGSYMGGSFSFPVQMRVTPSLTATVTYQGANNFGSGSISREGMNIFVQSTGTSVISGAYINNNSSDHITLDAEL